jgi:hypothetical protein
MIGVPTADEGQNENARSQPADGRDDGSALRVGVGETPVGKAEGLAVREAENLGRGRGFGASSRHVTIGSALARREVDDAGPAPLAGGEREGSAAEKLRVIRMG